MAKHVQQGVPVHVHDVVPFALLEIHKEVHSPRILTSSLAQVSAKESDPPQQTGREERTVTRSIVRASSCDRGPGTAVRIAGPVGSPAKSGVAECGRLPGTKARMERATAQSKRERANTRRVT